MNGQVFLYVFIYIINTDYMFVIRIIDAYYIERNLKEKYVLAKACYKNEKVWFFAFNLRFRYTVEVGRIIENMLHPPSNRYP